MKKYLCPNQPDHLPHRFPSSLSYYRIPWERPDRCSGERLLHATPQVAASDMLAQKDLRAPGYRLLGHSRQLFMRLALHGEDDFRSHDKQYRLSGIAH
jgi:hypothetical protein